jgi:hypothetical protein
MERRSLFLSAAAGGCVLVLWREDDREDEDKKVPQPVADETEVVAHAGVLTLNLDRRLPIRLALTNVRPTMVGCRRVERRRYPFQAMAGVTNRMFWMKASGRNSAGAMTQRLSGSLPMRTMPMCCSRSAS